MQNLNANWKQIKDFKHLMGSFSKRKTCDLYHFVLTILSSGEIATTFKNNVQSYN